MARRGLNGQLNMFDFFRELEAQNIQNGELEMVSLMPSFEDTEEVPRVEEVPKAEEPPRVEKAPREEKSPKVEKAVKVRKSPKADEAVWEMEEQPVPRKASVSKNSDVVMHRTYKTSQGTAEIAYINYNKVRISLPGQPPEVLGFASSKEAVNFYIEQMQRLGESV